MSVLDEARMYIRYAAGLPRFLRNPISLADAEAIVRRGIEEREESFLRLVEKGVFGYPRSPYRKLLRMARCEMGDLRDMVRQRGLESTLRTLRESGVYVTFEEYKGREPVVRGEESFAVSRSDFDNPFISSSYQSQTGGSTGAGTRIGNDLDHLATQSAHLMLAAHAHNALDVPFAIWRGVLPDGSGINNVLRAAHYGRVTEKWFSPTVPGAPPPAFRFQVGTYGTVVMGRLLGKALPWPEMVPIDQAIVVARWVAETVKKRKACLVSSPVSRALRICVAAQEAGLDLSGAVFQIAGEPPSPAKVAGIIATGARYFTTYGFAEGGRVAIGCRHPVSPNDLARR